MKHEVTIPNWAIFGAKVCGVCIYRYDDEDKTHYQAAYTLFLDNGEETDEETQQVVTIFTEMFSEDPEMLALEAADIAERLWHEVSSNVAIFDEDNELYRTLDLDIIAKNVETIYAH